MADGRRQYTRYYPGYRKGSITLIKRAEGGHKWAYKCDCGFEGITQVSENPGCCPVCSRKYAATKMTKHGESPDSGKNASRLYGIWLSMKQRCSNPQIDSYRYYGGRGIAVCEEWRDDYMTFKEWALNNGYDDSLTIDRIDANKGYCPENCRWADWETQCYNKRNTCRYEYKGKKYTLKELAQMSGNSYNTMKRRLNAYGWSVEDAINIPVKFGNNQTLRRCK